jgi:hypothetical protein|tara:strand:- start:35 stop:529 length:495 start_codon:yes stop_codon:yes gene_type:complete
VINKHLRAKKDFGYTIESVNLNNILFKSIEMKPYNNSIVEYIKGRCKCSTLDWCLIHTNRYKRLVEDIEKFGYIEHPLPLYRPMYKIYCYNVVPLLRHRIAFELGYNSIDSVVLSNSKDLDRLIELQTYDVRNIWPNELLEPNEKLSKEDTVIGNLNLYNVKEL